MSIQFYKKPQAQPASCTLQLFTAAFPGDCDISVNAMMPDTFSTKHMEVMFSCSTTPTAWGVLHSRSEV